MEQPASPATIPRDAPAERLLGLTLTDGWRVVERLVPSPQATGGFFSQGYIVEARDGTRAFLKALDYSSALQSPDPALELQAMTSAYNFERELLTRCRARRMDRVVRAISDGTVMVEPGNAAGVVQYLIFELADGDVRAQMDRTARIDTAWLLRSLHHVATGIFQLHGDGIAHQDLKPSNVLVFATGKYSKIGDLGRAATRGREPPHEDHAVAGDRGYAPPELLYDAVSSEWSARRFGCDAYLLGSMIVFVFTGASMTGLITGGLAKAHWPSVWQGSYEEILPFVRDAFGRAVDQFAARVPAAYRAILVEMVQQLCDPDPKLRGHPKNRSNPAMRYSVERYVSRLNLIAARAEYAIRASSA